MSRAGELLDEILRIMRSMKRPVVDHLNEGLGENLIKDKASRLLLALTPEVLDLYAWRNGVTVPSGATTDTVCFFPGYYFLSFDSALEHYDLLMRLAKDPEIADEMKWRQEWFPIFTNSAGDYYAVVLGEPPTEGSTVLRCFSYRLPLGQSAFKSIEAMLLVLLECYQTGVIYVGTDGCLSMDYKRFGAVAKRLKAS